MCRFHFTHSFNLLQTETNHAQPLSRHWLNWQIRMHAFRFPLEFSAFSRPHGIHCNRRLISLRAPERQKGPSITSRHTITSSSPGYYESFIAHKRLRPQLHFNINPFHCSYFPIYLYVARLIGFSTVSFISPPSFRQLSQPQWCVSGLQTFHYHSRKFTNQKAIDRL